MGAVTPILGLYKPGGGSTGTIVPDETADIDRLNENFDAIDAWAGTVNEKTTIATNSEIDAATNNTHIITPAGLKRASSYLGTATKTSGSTTTNSDTEETISTISLEVTTPRAGNVRLTVSMPSRSTSLSDVLMIRIKEGTTVRAEFNTSPNSSTTATGTTQSQLFSVVLVGVAAGEHIYQLRILRPTGTGTITVQATPLSPVQLTAEMMG